MLSVVRQLSGYESRESVEFLWHHPVAPRFLQRGEGSPKAGFLLRSLSPPEKQFRSG